MKPNLLLITDRASLARLHAQILVQSGIDVSLRSFANAKNKIHAEDLERYDLILLNMFDEENNALEICQKLRADFVNPILILTYQQDERFLLRAYEAGADDCMVQPFSINLLVAKIQPWLRQSGSSDKSIGLLEAYEFRFDPVKSEVLTPQENVVRLSQLEARLLHLLMVKHGQTVATDQIIQRVWPDSGAKDGDRHLLKALVHRLRRKIETNPIDPKYIHTVPHQGYSFRPQ